MIDRILRFALEQRLLVLMATALLIGTGIWAMKKLPVDAFPDVTNVQVQILTQAGGMAPTEVEQLVTFPLETTLGGLPRLHEVRSVSKIGLSVITVVFEDGADIYFARQQVFERLQQARDRLPKGLEPQLGPVTTGLGEIYQYIVQGKLDVRELRAIQDWVIRPMLRTVPGVTDVNSFGGEVKQYQVQVDPGKLKSLGLTLRNVYEAVEQNNTATGAGYIEHRQEQYMVRGVGLAKGVEDLKRIVVTARGGTPVRLDEVAELRIGSEPRQGATTTDGNGEAVAGIVLMLKGASSKEVVAGVKEKVQVIQKALPPGVKLVPYYDRTELVEKTIATVRTNLIEGGLLVVAVLFYFLGNLRGAVIVAVTIPLSMLFSFLGMQWLGLSANLMTLGAIDFGMIVDGSVVMVENTVRHLSERKEGEGTRHTIYNSAREVARPILFGVLIIIVVYLPIVTLTDMEGKMFSPMAFTVGFALLGSLLLTMTLVPTLCSFFLRGKVEEKDPKLLRLAREAYLPFLARTLPHPKRTLGVTAVLLGFSLLLVPLLGKEFLPVLDEGAVAIQSFRLPSVSLTDSVRSGALVEKALLSFPEVEKVVSRAGRAEIANDPMGVEVSDIFVSLKPRGDWKSAGDKEELVEKMRKRLENVPGMSYSFSQPIAMRVDELVSGVKSQVAVKLFGEDMELLKTKGEEISKVLEKQAGAADVMTEKVSGLAYLQVEVDREAISRYGINVADVREVLEIAVGGKQASEMFEGQKRFAIALRFPEQMVNSPDKIGEILIAAPGGARVPLKQLARIYTEEGPAQISRENGSRRIVVECNVTGRDLGGFVADAQRAIEAKVKLPPGYYLVWGGQFENQQRAMARLAVILPICLSLIFILLFSTFGSVRQAVLIILNVPFALIGGIMALFLRGLPLSVSGAIGFIALFGVAVLNGIVMVACFNKLRQEGRSLDEAILAGAGIRLRPVLMTALVASLGFIPMALSHGTGAEVQRPLATVVIGGLVTSTLLTLVVLPIFYRWWETRSEIARTGDTLQ
ncbi:efflux RND transporter permease subunit [Geomesophilobacter sediminis]|uniref:Efflux RND transporter permease subunit n=1 Tax=Geomesophilobacter sediminis TaxID=2798584 RepID=A0A8J7LTR3_9BACT|nr:efflux RND transporter permease subunit [Geomesophilobacter sediminis]MBJ6723719.1 efflux RND transporter permease subunit [Geomesophilobacter sediminis]